MCFTICGRFVPNEGGVAGYADRMRGKYTAKWEVQIAGMNFQTRSWLPLLAPPACRGGVIWFYVF
ncbi:DUF6783 domain-containing protein [Ruminococcus sp. 5_1_39BFAA]|uniref:DUF6783 domain-containing protein n=1 Tax=Ruminococcus sp. 5_1_39BFAA TaxID=457412 RepID=UPI003565361F